MLVNMGGPESRSELKTFLSRMFRDPHILPYRKPVRDLLSWIISTARYRKSWEKYELIGGTPLAGSTVRLVNALQSVLGECYVVGYAFSYSNPDIENALMNFKNAGIGDITVIPLYPQASHTTTSSVKADVLRISGKDSFFDVKVSGEFYALQGFVGYWIHLIQDHLAKNHIVSPTLVFSAHSIPKYHVANGDSYASAVVDGAAVIATALSLPFEVCFQSGMRRGTWIGPEMKEHLTILREEGVDNLVLIPISFVQENLETLYDLDRDILPYAKKTLGFSQVSRVNLPEVDPILVEMLAEMVTGNKEIGS